MAVAWRTAFVAWPVRSWRFARRFTGPVAALSLVAMCVVTVWVLLAYDPHR